MVKGNERISVVGRRYAIVVLVLIASISFTALKLTKMCSVAKRNKDTAEAQSIIIVKHSAGMVPAGEGKSFELAKRESYGFFDDISDTQWRIKRDVIKYTPWFYHPVQPETGIESINIWMMDNVHPMLTCPYMVRVGGMPDGGKWTCDPIRLTKSPDCLVYSVGSNGQHEFEDDIFEISGANKTCEIHVFDPNPKYEREGDVEQKNIHYHAWGISSSYREWHKFGDSSYIFHNFREIAEKLGHADRKIDIFKIDCEGCEWFAYKDMLAAFKHISQLLIEIHPKYHRPNDIGVSTLFQAYKDYGFVPFSKEANTYEAMSGVYEYSFIRLKLDD